MYGLAAGYLLVPIDIKLRIMILVGANDSCKLIDSRKANWQSSIKMYPMFGCFNKL